MWFAIDGQGNRHMEENLRKHKITPIESVQKIDCRRNRFSSEVEVMDNRNKNVTLSGTCQVIHGISTWIC